jgi:Ribbon-helix-helix protein, copG family
MRRTTILLADDLADQLEYERRRRNQSTAAIVREALTEYLAGGASSPGRLAFAGLGRSGYRDTSEKVEEILVREWAGKKRTQTANQKKSTGTTRRRR